jgi:hypothetical protein
VIDAMTKNARNTVVGVWIAVVLLVGGIGSGSATVMRVANGIAALGFGLLCMRALDKAQTVRVVIFALCALLFVLFTVMVAWTAPIYDLANEILDAM